MNRFSNSLKHIMAPALAAGFALAASALPARAVIATFQDGTPTPIVGGTYTGTEDTFFYTGFPDDNAGQVGGLATGTFGSVYRSLLRFDVSALAGQYAHINSITLKLDPSAIYATVGNTLDVFAVSAGNESWIEGTNSSATPGEPSWNHLAYPSTSWVGNGGVGGGADGTLLASYAWTTSTPTYTPLNGGLTFTGSSAALTALINAWIAGPNGGLLLRAADEVVHAETERMDFVSSDANAPDPYQYRPVLVVDFTTPEPASLGLLLLGATSLLGRRSRARA